MTAGAVVFRQLSATPLPVATLVRLGVAVIYSLAFIAAYVRFLHPVFGYMGFTLVERETTFLALAILLAVLPAALHSGVRTLSSVIAVFIYAALYVPIILTFALGSSLPEVRIVGIQLLFLAGMCVLLLVDRLDLARPVALRLRFDLSPVALAITLLLTLYILYLYRGSLRFASFGEAVYEQRMATADVGGAATGYLSTWLSTAFAPICLAYGLTARRLGYFLAGTAACVVLYMAVAAKIVILLPAGYLVFHAVFRHGRLRHVFVVLLCGLAAMIALLSLTADRDTLGFMASSLLLQRTVGNGGQITMAYHDFFSFFPQTNFTHINLVNLVTQAYPYGGLGVGQVIGRYLYDVNMNANANFWATDGIAALGTLGIPFASILLALVFVVMNALTRGYNRLFVALAFLPFVMYVLNTSLFSSMLSGGGILLLLYFTLNRHDPRVAERPVDYALR